MNSVGLRMMMALCIVLLLSRAASAESFPGIYVNVHESGECSVVYVENDGDGLIVSLFGGYSSLHNNSVLPRNCYLIAAGKPKDDDLVAYYVHEGPGESAYVHLKFNDGSLEVFNAFPYFEGCDINTRFIGVYNKYSCGEAQQLYSKDIGYDEEVRQYLEDICAE
ncbi:MAG: hypothetical protein AB7D51_09175 [Desulfovibrionaceae bacterium]